MQQVYSPVRGRKEVSHMNTEVGQKIKEIRTARGMTLKELSEKTGMSVSSLSLAERGLASINVASLKAISKSLGISVVYFFDEEINPFRHQYIFRAHEQNIVVANKRKIYNRVSHLGEKLMDPSFVVLLPGENCENLEHTTHEGEEFIYVIEGTLTWLMEGVRYELYPGDCLHMPSSVPHNWANMTNSRVKLLLVNTPCLFEDDEMKLDKHGAENDNEIDQGV